MDLPFFYIDSYDGFQKETLLDEDTSRHIVQSLRMKKGEEINLTDGKGNLLSGEIGEAYKRNCNVIIKGARYMGQNASHISIGISLLKNSSRFEWFLEKATEIGVARIIPLICERTEKQKFRRERMERICISAMLQSQQCWLPVLQEPVEFKRLILKPGYQQRFIAFCSEFQKTKLTNQTVSPLTGALILIGPEGDFTQKEIQLALENGYTPVSLGETRLRSETAGVVAVSILRAAR